MLHVVDLTKDSLVDFDLSAVLIVRGVILHLDILVTAVLLEELVHHLFSCLRVLRELDEKESHARIGEESFLSLLTVLVHGFAD